MDDLTARLPRRSQGAEIAAYGLPGLFGEFAERGVERLLFGGELALWDRPGAMVLLGPERAARVNEEYFRRRRAAAVDQDAGGIRHGGRSATPRCVSSRRTVLRRCRSRICPPARVRASPAASRAHSP